MIKSRCGFTLIELLVVITIIGILAAMLFPVFGAIRERGYQTQCLSNLRQLTMAAKTYESDYEMLPGPYEFVKGNWNSGNQGNITNGTLWPYVGNFKVYVCPTFRARCGTTKVVWSYSMNGYVGWYASASPTDTSKGRTTWNRCWRTDSATTGHLVMFAEEDWWSPLVIHGRTYPSAINDGALWTDGSDSLGDFHEGAVNISFVDGHVERMKWLYPDPQDVNGYYCWPHWTNKP